MREQYNRQLRELRAELVLMGAMCEEAINCAIQGILENDENLRKKTFLLSKEISSKEKEVEKFCFRLIVREQPVAGDFRLIAASMKMATSMYRISDQTADITLLFEEISVEQRAFVYEYIGKMVSTCSKMLVEAVNSFVHNDVEKAREVIALDDAVDNYFSEIKTELIGQIAKDSSNGETWLDILMMAKHLERMGDHAKKIAKMVIYSV